MFKRYDFGLISDVIFYLCGEETSEFIIKDTKMWERLLNGWVYFNSFLSESLFLLLVSKFDSGWLSNLANDYRNSLKTTVIRLNHY